jgi:hypothetical protein
LTPKEFTDIYPPGTKIHFDLDYHHLGTMSWPNGVCTFLGLSKCDSVGECNADCDGMLRLQEPNNRVRVDCMCFNTNKLDGELPLGRMGVIPNIIKDEDFEI